MNFQRARSDDQIQNRIQEIVNATSEIYDSVGYEGLNFSAISKHTNFTRPNIYKYFKTKDEILLVIMKQDLISFISTLTNSFKINKIYSLQEISKIWTEALMRHERFLNLNALLSTVIEKNVSVEALAEFKKGVIPMIFQLSDLVSQLFPNANNEAITNFVYSHLTLAFGLYPSSKINSIQKDAIKMSGLEYSPVDFERTYTSALYQLMYCLENSIDVK